MFLTPSLIHRNYLTLLQIVIGKWNEGEYFSDLWTILTFMVVVATLAILLGRWYLIITHRRKVAKEKV